MIDLRVLVAFALGVYLGVCLRPSAPAPPSASAPSRADLVGSWTTPSGIKLEIGADGTWRDYRVEEDDMYDAGGTWSWRGGAVIIAYMTGDECTEPGRYRVGVVGEALALVPEVDACDARRQRLSQAFERVTRAYCEQRSARGESMAPDCCDQAVDGEGCD